MNHEMLDAITLTLREMLDECAEVHSTAGRNGTIFLDIDMPGHGVHGVRLNIVDLVEPRP